VLDCNYPRLRSRSNIRMKYLIRRYDGTCKYSGITSLHSSLWNLVGGLVKPLVLAPVLGVREEVGEITRTRALVRNRRVSSATVIYLPLAVPPPTMSSTPGSSRALQIPPRSPTSDSDSAGFVTDRASFVGSPDALPPNENAASRSTMYLPPSPLSLHPPPSSRPGMGQRSVSTPGTPSTLRSSRRIPVVQSARRVASRMLRLSEGGEGVDPPLSSSHPREREWTLFGQRMENEGQLRASGVDFGAATYRLSRNLRSPNMEESNTYDSRLTASSESGLSVEQNVYTTGSAVQSPAADPSMPDPFDAATNPGHGQTVSSYDFTYDSDDTSSTHSVEQQPSPVVLTPKKTSWGIPTLTPLHRNILKCGIAYFIGSLFTFNPYLSGLISDITSASGPSPSGHMVATVSAISHLIYLTTVSLILF
jgi:hypothetical protein